MYFFLLKASLFQTLEVMVKELKDLQGPEGDLLLRKPGRSVLQGISSLRAPVLCCALEERVMDQTGAQETSA